MVTRVASDVALVAGVVARKIAALAWEPNWLVITDFRMAAR